ncbi:MAG TPA: glutamate-1-semialdehyde 2,1-aminomutase [bacterium]|nr:glutamate-1-semialdehyde 2,1-aminomutase [bacterium]
MKRTKSKKLFEEAVLRIPGGVSSPVRAFKAVGGEPLFIRSAKGSKLTDADGNIYVDYVGSWGPMILGHAHPRVIGAIAAAAKRGTSFGAPCELEVALAGEVVKAYPSIQKVRFVSSGTEAVMGALRAARGFTGRKKVIKFDGCYHGHADYLLVKAGSGAQTLGQPDSAGVPQEFTAETLVARFNDATSVEAICKAYPSEIAAIIVEPVVGNMGVILPRDGFLQKLREICDREEIVLVFDEVMTGFRLAYGGAQEVYGVRPDLTALGKIVGGGMPVGAYGGRSEIMDMVAPVGPVYQAGTLSGNPVAMAAGLETLKILKATKPYRTLEKTTRALCDGLREAAKSAGVPVFVAQAGSMFTVFFVDQEVRNADDARRCDTGRFAAFFRGMLEKGISLAPSQFEACFVSSAHAPADVAKTLKAAHVSLTRVPNF